MTKRCTYSDIREGDVVTRFTQLRVEKVIPNGLIVRNSTGQTSSIVGKELIEYEFSTTQYSKTEKLPMTKLAEEFVNIPQDVLFEVSFVKKDGTHRILKGYRFNNKVNHLGRSNVYDVECILNNNKHCIREVDHRTINYFICQGVKYQLK